MREVKMRTGVPDRYRILKTLRDVGPHLTVVATDLSLPQSNILIKTFRKAFCNFDRAQIDERLSWFMGMKHKHIASILDAGFTLTGDFYTVRQYLPEQRYFGSDIEYLRTLV